MGAHENKSKKQVNSLKHKLDTILVRTHNRVISFVLITPSQIK